MEKCDYLVATFEGKHIRCDLPAGHEGPHRVSDEQAEPAERAKEK